MAVEVDVDILYTNGETSLASDKSQVIIGLDGGATSTVCVCVSAIYAGDTLSPQSITVLGRAVGGCSNHNSVGETTARENLKHVMDDALSISGSSHSAVRAVCLAMSGVNHPSDEGRIKTWLRNVFPGCVYLHVKNDAVAALSSGTMGSLNGCVLIAGTGMIAYGFAEDGGRQAWAAGAGPILGDWGSGYGISAQALEAVMKAHDGRGPSTILTTKIIEELNLSSPDDLIRWTYRDSSWARIASLVPTVVSCAGAGDVISQDILRRSIHELVTAVRAVVLRLLLCGRDGNHPFPFVLVGGVLNSTDQAWDISKEVISQVVQEFPGARPIRPKVEPAIGAAFLALNLFRDSLL